VTGEETQRHRAEVAEGRARRGWYWWLVMVLTAVVGPGLAIGVSSANQHRSEQAWCGIISTLDDAYRATPPTSPVGIRVAAAMARLRKDYHCPPT
jgi:hypothetical protein